jgi:hypothetical protein
MATSPRFHPHDTVTFTIMLRQLARVTRSTVSRRTFQSSSRVLAEEAPAGAEATKVTLNFAVPHTSIYESTEGT